MHTSPRQPIGRRRFVRTLASAAAAAGGIRALAAATPAIPARKPARKLALGFDNFSVRALGLTAPALVDYAAQLEVDSLLLSDLKVYERRDDAYLADLRKRADDAGIALQAGTGGICPTSPRCIKDYGTPEEHLALAIRIARALGSSVVRCFLGGRGEREGPGGIQRHIASTVEVCKKVRSLALDSGVKIAVENHAGDMQARELVGLIEAAGKDYVGATVDSGNATWTLEDPVRNLELLGPYVVSAGIRDSMVWTDDNGAVAQWTALGDGCVDMKKYVETFARLCPNAPFQLEIISGAQRAFPYLKPDFWGPYEDVRAVDLAAFLALAKKGRPMQRFQPPKGAARQQAIREFQKTELERSIRYAKDVLGVGRR